MVMVMVYVLILSVMSALLSFLFLLDTCFFVWGCDLIWASISATFHVF
jgi:hypothetical protein